jgi:3-hydroxyisobutyrate dehydrogenase-like beta-hydroxyacid dehydrogenase
VPGVPDLPAGAGEQRELLARLRAVVEAKDAEVVMLRAELAATAPLSEAGAAVAASARDAAQDAQLVITMLPTAGAVDSVVFAEDVAKAFAAGAVWAQMGTIGVTATAGIADRLGRLRPDVMFVDAPVSGSKGPAETGQLLILASGPPTAEPVVRPAFAAIGRKTVWLGEAGQGSAMKLVVNAYMSVLALSRQWRAAVDAGYGREDVSAARLALGGGAHH